MKQIKPILLLFVLLLLYNTIQAQESSFNLGVGGVYGIGVNVSYDQEIKQLNEHSMLTLGGYLGLQRGDGYAMDGSNRIYDWDYKGFVAPRMTYVYAVSEKLKLYAALMPGLLLINPDEDYRSFGFRVGVTGGLRVKLHKNTFFFTELGYNLLCINIGLSF